MQVVIDIPEGTWEYYNKLVANDDIDNAQTVIEADEEE